jgi:hypothetical protein
VGRQAGQQPVECLAGFTARRRDLGGSGDEERELVERTEQRVREGRTGCVGTAPASMAFWSAACINPSP